MAHIYKDEVSTPRDQQHRRTFALLTCNKVQYPSPIHYKASEASTLPFKHIPKPDYTQLPPIATHV